MISICYLLSITASLLHMYVDNKRCEVPPSYQTPHTCIRYTLVSGPPHFIIAPPNFSTLLMKGPSHLYQVYTCIRVPGIPLIISPVLIVLVHSIFSGVKTFQVRDQCGCLVIVIRLKSPMKKLNFTLQKNPALNEEPSHLLSHIN